MLNVIIVSLCKTETLVEMMCWQSDMNHFERIWFIKEM